MPCQPFKRTPIAILLMAVLVLMLAFPQPVWAQADLWPHDPLNAGEGVQGAPVPGCAANLEQLIQQPLALSDAIALALCHNPQTREGWARIQAAVAGVGSARAAYLPSLTGSAGLTRDVTNAANPLNESAGTSLTPGLTLDYLLLDFGGRSATHQQTRSALLAADFSHQNTLQTVLFAALKAYYQLYASNAAVVAADASLQASDSSLAAAGLRHKVGAASLADKLQAETAQAQAVLKLEQAKNQQLLAKGALANALGLSPDAALTLPSAAPMPLKDQDALAVAGLLEQAKKQRPDLAANAAQLAAAQANIQYQQAAGLPKLSLTAGQQWANDFNHSGRNRDGSSLGLNLSIPIFTGFDRSYQIEGARQQALAQAAANQTAENAALLEVWNSHSNFHTAQQTLRMTDALLSSAEQSERVALGRYKAGAGSITDLLTVQAQLADARQQRVQAQYGWLTSKADLLRAVGALTPTASVIQPEPAQPPAQLPEGNTHETP